MNLRSLFVLTAVVAATFSLLPNAGAKGPDGHAMSSRFVRKLIVREQFGVSHPAQIIDFDLSEPRSAENTLVVGPDDLPVPFQILSGNRLAVAVDGLAANTTKTWTVCAGLNGNVATDLDVRETETFYEITNGRTGVRVPKAPPNLEAPPAPISGVRLGDGTWTGTGAVLPVAAVSMRVRFLERGPLKAVVAVDYRFADAARYYTSTITVEAGQPSFLIEDDATVALSYSLDCHPGVEPTRRRYQGHHASSPAKGRALDGSDYGAIHRRNPAAVDAGGSDAVADLQFMEDAPSVDATAPDNVLPRVSIRRISLWYPWAVDGGWYDMFYNASAGPEGNVLGLFAGRASRALGAQRSGVGFFTKAGDQTTRRAGITVTLDPQAVAGAALPRARFSWGLFVGRKDTALTADGVIPPINLQMNLHGAFNLNKLHRYQLEFSDPPGGWGGLFLPREKLDALRLRVRADSVYRDYAKRHAPGYAALFTANDDAYLRLVVRDTAADARAALDAYVNGSGIYTFTWWYWIGAQVMNMRAMLADPVLGDPLISASDRERLKACMALFGYMVWDDDFVPFQSDSGLYVGNANMPRQQRGYRNLFSLLLAGHPHFSAHAGEVTASVRDVLRQSINEHGASDASPNYTHASVETAIGLALMLKSRGWADLFADEPRLAKFAEFFMQVQTPPEPRLAGRRGYLPIGDGELAPTELPGLLGTGFRGVNNALSERLIATWLAGGRHQNHYAVPTLLLIDGTLPAAGPNLRSEIFPGYFSVLRSGYGNANETAGWLLGGEFYQDHRHNDRGSVTLYALGQPLSTDWSDGYNPRLDGSYTKSSVVFADSIGGGWSVDGPGFSHGTSWASSAVEALVGAAGGGTTRSTARSHDTVWTRRLTLCAADPARPVFLIGDTFAGAHAAAEKIMTLNLCATGGVATAAGLIFPIERLAPERASAGPIFSLPAGVQRLRFTGAFGIDFDVYVVGDRPQQALLGNFGITVGGGVEAAAPRVERQHILRVKGGGRFRTLIVPWRKGEQPADLLVQATDGEVTVRQNGRVITFTDSGYTVSSP